MFRTRAAFGMVAAAAAVVLMTGTPSYAASYSMQTDDGDPGGKITFDTYGDIVTVRDQEPDGWAVKGWVYNPNGSVRYTLQANSYGDTDTARASDGGSHNLAENTTYKFRVCLHRSTVEAAYCDESYWLNVN